MGACCHRAIDVQVRHCHENESSQPSRAGNAPHSTREARPASCAPRTPLNKGGFGMLQDHGPMPSHEREVRAVLGVRRLATASQCQVLSFPEALVGSR